MSDAGMDWTHYRTMVLVRQERLRQLRKWGVQNHPNGTGSPMAAIFADQLKTICDGQNQIGQDDWATIAAEEVMEALTETDETKLLSEVIQSAAVFVAWAENIVGRLEGRNSNKQEESSK